MKNRINQYRVSSADWSFEIDEKDSKKAALSGIIEANRRLGKKMNVSTVTEVLKLPTSKTKSIDNLNFYATHSLFYDLGYKDLAKSLKSISENIPYKRKR